MIFIAYLTIGILYAIARYGKIRRVAKVVVAERCWRFLSPAMIEMVGASSVCLLWPIFVYIDITS